MRRIAAKPDSQQQKPKGDVGQRGSDVADWGELDLSKDYPPGTHFHMPDGAEIDMNALPDPFEGKGTQQ